MSRHTRVAVERLLTSLSQDLKGKTVIDIPAGMGRSSRLLQHLGADVHPYDLVPETFQTDGLQCEKADLETGLPITTGSVDVVLCQEGIEHIGNQVRAFREFARILKPGGRLILSTPNQSNLKYKASFLLLESEAFRRMPPNEIDSGEVREGQIRFGHVFLIGIQRLRLFAKLAGLHVKKIHYCGTSPTAVVLWLVLSPVILAIATKAFLQTMSKRRRHPASHVYRELYTLAIDPRILIGRHLLVEFEKGEMSSFRRRGV